MWSAFDLTSMSLSGQNVLQISSNHPRCRDVAAMLAMCSQASRSNPMTRSEMRIQQLENQLAAAHRPERGAAVPQPATRGAPEDASGRRSGSSRRAASVDPAQHGAAERRRRSPGPAWHRLPSPAYEQQQIAAPAPIVQESVGAPPPSGRRRGDAFDPAKIRMLLARRARSAAVSCRFRPKRRSARPGGAGPGRAARSRQHRCCPRIPGRAAGPRAPVAAPRLTTLPPSATSEG